MAESGVNKILKLTAKAVGTDATTSSASSVYGFYARGNQLYAVHLENTNTDAVNQFAVYGKQTGGELHALSTDQIFNYAGVASIAGSGKTYCIINSGGDHYLEIRMRGAAALTVNMAIDGYQGQLPPLSTLGSISSIGTVAAVTNVVSLDTCDVVSSVTNIVSLDTVDVVSSVTNIVSLDTCDVVSSVTNVVSLDTVDVVSSVTNIVSLDTVDSVTSVGTLASVTSFGTANTLASVATLGSVTTVADFVGADTVNDLVNVEEQSPEVSAYSSVVTHLSAVTADTTSDYYTMVADGYGCGHVHCQYVATAADTAYAYLLARVDSTLTADTLATIDLTSTAAQTIIGTFEVDFPYSEIAINYDAGTTNGTFSAKGVFRGGR